MRYRRRLSSRRRPTALVVRSSDIHREIARARDITEDAKALIEGTWINFNGTVIDEIRKLKPEDQVAHVEKLLAERKAQEEEKAKRLREMEDADVKATGKKVKRDARGKPVPAAASPALTPKARDDKAVTNFFGKATWGYAFNVFEEASPEARKRIVARLATELDAKIVFAGVHFKPAKVSLCGEAQEAASDTEAPAPNGQPSPSQEPQTSTEAANA